MLSLWEKEIIRSWHLLHLIAQEDSGQLSGQVAHSISHQMVAMTQSCLVAGNIICGECGGALVSGAKVITTGVLHKGRLARTPPGNFV